MNNGCGALAPCRALATRATPVSHGVRGSAPGRERGERSDSGAALPAAPPPVLAAAPGERRREAGSRASRAALAPRRGAAPLLTEPQLQRRRRPRGPLRRLGPRRHRCRRRRRHEPGPAAEAAGAPASSCRRQLARSGAADAAGAGPHVTGRGLSDTPTRQAPPPRRRRAGGAASPRCPPPPSHRVKTDHATNPPRPAPRGPARAGSPAKTLHATGSI